MARPYLSSDFKPSDSPRENLPISKEMKLRVSKALKSQADIRSPLGKTIVTKEDLERLEGTREGGWLSDSLLIFYLELIVMR